LIKKPRTAEFDEELGLLKSSKHLSPFKFVKSPLVALETRLKGIVKSLKLLSMFFA